MDNTSNLVEQPIQNSDLILNSNSTKRNKILFIEATVSFFILFLIGYVIFQHFRNSAKITQQVKTVEIPSSTPIPKRIDMNLYNPLEELSNFPIYPKSIFVKKEKIDPCPGKEKSPLLLCNAVTYTWQTHDDFDEVSKWFREDPTHTGWKCPGGAGGYGGPRDANGVIICTNKNTSRTLQINADEIKTEFILEIPINEYKGKYVN